MHCRYLRFRAVRPFVSLRRPHPSHGAPGGGRSFLHGALLDRWCRPRRGANASQVGRSASWSSDLEAGTTSGAPAGDDGLVVGMVGFAGGESKQTDDDNNDRAREVHHDGGHGLGAGTDCTSRAHLVGERFGSLSDSGAPSDRTDPGRGAQSTASGSLASIAETPNTPTARVDDAVATIDAPCNADASNGGGLASGSGQKGEWPVTGAGLRGHSSGFSGLIRYHTLRAVYLNSSLGYNSMGGLVTAM